MSFREQLQHVRSSSVLAGAHGAALMHMLFIAPTAGVIEISSERFWLRTNYAAIAYNLNLTYSLVLVASSGSSSKDKFYVPPPELMSIVREHLPIKPS